MKVFTLIYLGTLVFSSSAMAQAAVPDCPSATGAYLLQGDAWTAVDPSHSIGFKTTNVAGAAFSYGLAKAKVKAQFRDGKSPYQLKDNMLSMCLVNVVDTGRDITLARLQEEKDHRELAMASYRLWTGVNAQIDPKDVVATIVEKRGEKQYLIRSKESLSAGEFILFTIVPDLPAMMKANTPGSLGGYDFGMHAK